MVSPLQLTTMSNAGLPTAAARGAGSGEQFDWRLEAEPLDAGAEFLSGHSQKPGGLGLVLTRFLERLLDGAPFDGFQLRHGRGCSVAENIRGPRAVRGGIRRG